MSRFCPLASSSKGNSTYVAGGKTTLLVDVGISCKRVAQSLAEIGSSLSEISGILITHEHSDHVKGLDVLLRKINVPVYGTEKTLEHLSRRGIVPQNTTLVPVKAPFCVGDIQITPFDTPHDAVHSVGYRMELPDGRKIGFATDLGHITDTVHEHLLGCDLVMLESNFDPGMLSCSHYPYSIKRRIQGSEGHLSNEDCAGQIMELVQGGTTRFMLGHLSENNNMPEIAFHTTKNTLDFAAMTEKKDYLLSVAPAAFPHELVVF